MKKANTTLSAVSASDALSQPDIGPASLGSMMTPELKAAVEKVNAWHWGQEQERLQQSRSQAN